MCSQSRARCFGGGISEAQIADSPVAFHQDRQEQRVLQVSLQSLIFFENYASIPCLLTFVQPLPDQVPPSS